MNSGALNAQIEFLREIEKLKTVTRANRTLDGRSENSAEHSWHVTLMALLLQQHAEQSLDIYNPAIYANNDDRYYSPSFGIDFRTEIHLKSSDQLDVSALTCTEHRPQYGYQNSYPGREHFESALGDLVTLP